MRAISQVIRVSFGLFLISSAGVAAPPCGSVLIYYGNGGFVPGIYRQGLPEQGNYWALEAYYEGLGLGVDYTDSWPADVAYRDLVILVIPGDRDDFGGSDFTADQVADLLAMLGNGGRLLVLGEWGTQFGHRTQNRLLQELQVGIRVDGERASGETIEDLRPDFLTEDLDYVDGADVGSLTLSGTAKELGVTGGGDVVWAVDQSALTSCSRPGCDVVVLADTNMLDDMQKKNLDVLYDSRPGLNEHWEQMAWNLVSHSAGVGDAGEALKRRCEGRARTHGQYVSCIAVGSMELLLKGCLTMEERRQMVRDAAHSDVGKKPRRR